MTHTTTEAAPARLKKRNVGKVVTAGVATFAGIALAATAFQVTQDGSATFTPDYVEPTPEDVAISPETYSVTAMDLGDLTGSSTDNRVNSTFSIVNESDQRGEARMFGVEDDGSELFGLIQVKIVRRDPGNGTQPVVIHEGPLSELNSPQNLGKYMGDVVARGAQVFDVEAWVEGADTSDTPDPEAISTAFTVTYGVYGYSEGEPADQVRKGLEGGS